MSVLFNLEALVLGVALIALGVVWMMANLGQVDLLGTVHRWWPSVLVFWGALSLARSMARRSLHGERR
jgi:hypothetical protein